MLNRSDRVLVLGAAGLVGSAFVRLLQAQGFENILACTRSDVDLLDALAVRNYFQQMKPEYVLMAAGRVGGIWANSNYPWDFIYDNVVMAANVLEAARQNPVKKILMLGSSCIYPREAHQPIQEKSLLAGPLEPTNEWYAVAKIAGIKLGQALCRQHGIRVIAAMPTNLYGPGDNFHPTRSHVVPALIRRFHEAKVAGAPSVALWGTGTPRRELLYVDDLARALLLLFEKYEDEDIINIGSGEEVTIGELAQTVARAVGYQGQLEHDLSKPDGVAGKRLDITRIRQLGWSPTLPLEQGLAKAYQWFLEHHVEAGAKA